MHTNPTMLYSSGHYLHRAAVSREVIQTRPFGDLTKRFGDLVQKIENSSGVETRKRQTWPPASVYLSSPTVAECLVQSLLVAISWFLCSFNLRGQPRRLNNLNRSGNKGINIIWPRSATVGWQHTELSVWKINLKQRWYLFCAGSDIFELFCVPI